MRFVFISSVTAMTALRTISVTTGSTARRALASCVSMLGPGTFPCGGLVLLAQREAVLDREGEAHFLAAGNAGRGLQLEPHPRAAHGDDAVEQIADIDDGLDRAGKLVGGVCAG